jgi:hypothetical protein
MLEKIIPLRRRISKSAPVFYHKYKIIAKQSKSKVKLSRYRPEQAHVDPVG